MDFSLLSKSLQRAQLENSSFGIVTVPRIQKVALIVEKISEEDQTLLGGARNTQPKLKSFKSVFPLFVTIGSASGLSVEAADPDLLGYAWAGLYLPRLAVLRHAGQYTLIHNT